METTLKAFVYIWWELSTGKYYIGYHIGSPTDGYICSSQLIRDQIIANRDKWQREIVIEGQNRYCRMIEKEIIAACINDERCLNQAISEGSLVKFKDINLTTDTMTPEVKLMLTLLGEQDV